MLIDNPSKFEAYYLSQTEEPAQWFAGSNLFWYDLGFGWFDIKRYSVGPFEKLICLAEAADDALQRANDQKTRTTVH